MLRRFLSIIPVLALTACGGDGNGASADASGEVHASAAAARATPASPAARPAEQEHQAAAGQGHQERHHGDDDDHGEPNAVLAALGGDFVNADLANGARQFRRCQSCHTLNEGARHTVGPNLYGVIGRPAASAEGFSYSSQLSESGLTWDTETLGHWIENPRAFVPGNRMSFVGLRDADDRRDVIAYIAVETAGDDED